MSSPFTAAPHHDILVLLVQVAVLLLTARAMGEIARRLGQPAVVGEISAGILLGPSLLSGFIPAIGAWIVPGTPLSGYLLEVVALFGALFLLLITGLETDLGLIRQHARTAIGVSMGGIIVTLVTGFALGWSLPDELLGNPGDPQGRLVFAMFVATAMSISAIPVIAKVLMDLNLMRRDIGQTIIAAGMSDDTIGWMLLSIVAGLAGTGVITGGAIFQAVGSVVLFMAASFTLGRWLVKRSLDFVQDEVRAPDRLVTLVIVLTLAWGAVTQALGLEAVLGAFVMGILFGQQPRLPDEVHDKLNTISLAVFTPIFFAVAGLKVNARVLLEPDLLFITLLVIAVASGGKVLGTYLGARLIGKRDHWTALSFGAGLNARGAMEIIIATIGLELGILSQEMFSIIVVMAMATSLMAPPALRWVLARVTPEAQELERLRKEEAVAASKVAQIHRVLLPVRVRPISDTVHSLESHLLARLGRERPISVTLLNITSREGRAESQKFLDDLSKGFEDFDLVRKIVESDDPAGTILTEAQKDYDLMLVGATERGAAMTDAVFHPLVDRLVRLAPCPTVVVKGGGGVEQAEWSPGRILVPTNGSRAARQAADLAFRLAGPDEEVVLLNVVREPEHQVRHALRGSERYLTTGKAIVDELYEAATAQSVRAIPLVRTGADPDEEILAVANEMGCGLAILGTNVRPGSERLFLGPRVERILEDAPCPVLVFNDI